MIEIDGSGTNFSKHFNIASLIDHLVAKKCFLSLVSLILLNSSNSIFDNILITTAKIK